MTAEAAQASLALRPVGLLDRPKAAFVTRLRPGRLPTRAARQLPDLPTIIWVESSSTGETRHRGARQTWARPLNTRPHRIRERPLIELAPIDRGSPVLENIHRGFARLRPANYPPGGSSSTPRVAASLVAPSWCRAIRRRSLCGRACHSIWNGTGLMISRGDPDATRARPRNSLFGSAVPHRSIHAYWEPERSPVVASTFLISPFSMCRVQDACLVPAAGRRAPVVLPEIQSCSS
jgi:hypothetical protein